MVPEYSIGSVSDPPCTSEPVRRRMSARQVTRRLRSTLMWVRALSSGSATTMSKSSIDRLPKRSIMSLPHRWSGPPLTRPEKMSRPARPAAWGSDASSGPRSTSESTCARRLRGKLSPSAGRTALIRCALSSDECQPALRLSNVSVSAARATVARTATGWPRPRS